MTWIVYKIVFRMESPLHSGAGTVGNIQKTHPYVTGRMIWGALTARLTRMKKSQDYKGIGEAVNQHMRFTYLFPCFDPAGEFPILPSIKEAPSPDALILTVHTGTAIDPGAGSALDTSLHETELISHRVLRNGAFNEVAVKSGAQIYLTGYFFTDDKLPNDLKWEDALPYLQLGGDGGYGYGRVSLFGKPEETDSIWNGYKLDLSSDNPIVTINADKPILAHVDASSATNDLLDGPLVPWMGRETKQMEHCATRTTPVIRWVPGSRVKEPTQFKITEFGFWTQQTTHIKDTPPCQN